MGEFVLRTIERSPRHKNTAKDYAREIQEERYKYVLQRVSSNIPNNKACYVFGMGKHRRSTYKAFKKTLGVEVIWFGSLLPTYLSPLRIFIASYEGIIKVHETQRIKDVFEALSRMSMVGLYIFDKELEDSFVRTIREKKYSNYADEVVKEDSGYFIYQIDADSLESSTGIYEIVSYGKDCARELVSAL